MMASAPTVPRVRPRQQTALAAKCALLDKSKILPALIRTEFANWPARSVTLDKLAATASALIVEITWYPMLRVQVVTTALLIR
jgi:hypothetical protein